MLHSVERRAGWCGSNDQTPFYTARAYILGLLKQLIPGIIPLDLLLVLLFSMSLQCSIALYYVNNYIRNLAETSESASNSRVTKSKRGLSWGVSWRVPCGVSHRANLCSSLDKIIVRETRSGRKISKSELVWVRHRHSGDVTVMFAHTICCSTSSWAAIHDQSRDVMAKSLGA